jgi:hypothetical protein
MLLIVIFNSSCKKDQLNTNNKQLITQKQNKNDTLETISYAAFLKSLDIEKTGALKHLLLSKGQASKQVYSKENGTVNGFELDMNNVKKLNLGDTVSYVISFKPQTPRATHFENLTLQIVNGKIKAFITTYIPTKEWIDDWLSVKHLAFKGETFVNFIDLDTIPSAAINTIPEKDGARKNISSVSQTNAITLNNVKINLLPGECEFTDVYEKVPYQCSTGDWPGSCYWETHPSALEPGQYPPGYYISRYTIVNCAMPNIPGAPASGGGGGGGGTTPNPPGDYNPCNNGPVAVASIKNGIRLNLLPPSDCDPRPTQPPVVPEEPPIFTLRINTDSLSKNFPCATKLILNKLIQDPNYFTWIAPFSSNIKPDIVWKNGPLAWNSSNPLLPGSTTTYMLGATSTIGRSAEIILNNNMLQNSSQLFIASAVIHETLHAFINYNIRTYVDGFKVPSNYSSSKPWLYSLNVWAIMDGLPSNYRDHDHMMNDYFDKGIAILKKWDNNGHTDKEYAMTMLYGLDTGDFPVMQSSLAQTYTNLMTRYNITNSDLQTFWMSNLKSANNKLPISGC